MEERLKEPTIAAGDRRLTISGLIALAISASLLASYLGLEPLLFWRPCFFFVVAGFWLCCFHRELPTKRELFVFGSFSLAFSLCIVLGCHIVYSGDPHGLSDSNYISDYTFIDLVAFFGMLPAIFVFSSGFLRALRNFFALDGKGALVKAGLTSCNIDFRSTIVFAGVLFALWIPYLIVYYPGLIFGDSLSSLNQALGGEPWNNHHPVLYSAFIGLCLNVSHLFGFGNAAGCALYCVIQMAFMAGCLSYAASWVISLFILTRVKRLLIRLAILLLFGASSYFASFSIAVWKDPFFSAALMMLTLFLSDAILGRRVRCVVLRVIAFVTFSAVVVFSRNNGVYILVLICLILAASCFFRTAQYRSNRLVTGLGPSSLSRGLERGPRGLKTIHAPMALGGFLVVVVFCLVSGPVYSSLGISGSPASESLGIPINQMARVAAYGGEMSDSDRDYLDSVFPIDEYSTHYYPCCVDNLKWNQEFDSEALTEDFASHWVSMLLNNPRTYFEAWELQTFGFWTVNQPATYDFDNISTGVPRNATEGLSGQLASFGIDPNVGIHEAAVRAIFPINESSIPIGVLFWFMVYLGCCMVTAKKSWWLAMLVPSLALMLTLFVASPIWYWPRYAAVIEFSLPFYIALLLYLVSQEGSIEKQFGYTDR